MKILNDGITAPVGFEAAYTCAGIKYENRPDMALIYSDVPCEVAGVFTKNIVKAAPVVWDMDVVASGIKPQAVVVNSGIANACTGEPGMECCKMTAQCVAGHLNIDKNGVLIGSTGVIGMHIPVDKLKAGIAGLAESKSSSRLCAQGAARAIMTTDTYEKELAVETIISGKTVKIGGIAKGSGMIHPDMCTMLAFITTDANISKSALQSALIADTESTFNMISVDGDTSTNDTVLLLANGRAGNDRIEVGTEDYDTFCEALNVLTKTMAKGIAADGEGATALLEVTVIGAPSVEQARVIAKSVITSNLTKTAIAGHDANWGRVLCAMGYSGEAFDPDKVTLSFKSGVGEVVVFKNGLPVEFDEDFATGILSESMVTIFANLNAGDAQATAWGCDLTHGYISINADYRS